MVELREDVSFSRIMAAMEGGGNKLDVKMPRSGKQYVSADFVIDQGFRKLLDGSMVKVFLESKRKDVVHEAHQGVIMAHFSPRRFYRQLKDVVF